MKLMIAFFLFSLSLSVFAEEKQCLKKCQSSANQMSLQCHKLSQICYTRGQPDSLPYELCMDDYYQCVQDSRVKLEACLNECQEK